MRLFLFLLAVLVSLNLYSQYDFRVVSYNVENLFDYEDDPLKDDDAFTEYGEYKWDERKYRRKLNDISKVITAVGEWNHPQIVGLCEIENARVLNDLLTQTQLKNVGYVFLHHDSPDRRGVDVALLYKPEEYKVVSVEFLTVVTNKDERPTREILFASGVVPSGDTLHVFVNHWPSRYGGELESQHKRVNAARTVRHKVDSLFAVNLAAKIIIIGDFNDYPDDVSIREELGASMDFHNPKYGSLFNLMAKYYGQKDVGTHKFAGEWGVLDHIIVSGSLLDCKTSFCTDAESVHIFKESFLLKKDKTDFAPKRAFLGAFYAYGFSDHLPVYVDFKYRTSKEGF